MTKVYFIRHAEPNYSNHNDRERELTPKGLRDRSLVTRFLSDKGVEVVISSPYRRAIDTIDEFASAAGLSIELMEDFRERRVDSCWIEDFTAFSKQQWSDFSYKLSDGECLAEVQERNISALKTVLEKYSGKVIAIAGHGTAISTVINYFDSAFGYSEFERIKSIMPWIVEFDFDENLGCIAISDHRFDR